MRDFLKTKQLEAVKISQNTQDLSIKWSCHLNSWAWNHTESSLIFQSQQKSISFQQAIWMGKALGYRMRRTVHDPPWEPLILPTVASPEVPLLPGPESVLLSPVWFAKPICRFSFVLFMPPMESEAVVLFFQVGVTLDGLMVTAFTGLDSILILFPKKRTEKNYFSKRNVRVKAVLYVYFPEVSFATIKFHFSLFASWTSLQQNTFRFPCI